MKIFSQCKKMLADLQTPVGIYLKVRDLFDKSALLESSDYQSAETARSLIGLQPMASFMLCGNTITLYYPSGEEKTKEVSATCVVADELNRFIQSFRPEPQAAAQSNGFLGYTGYDAVRHFEAVDIQQPAPGNAPIPDMYYILYKYQIVVNHFNNELTITENLLEGEESNLSKIENVLNNRNFPIYDFEVEGEERSTITDEQYKAMVTKGIAHCKRGDVFQIVLSRRFSQAFRGDEFNVYRSLRSVNPSPYLFYFDFGTFRIFGSSPETHLYLKGGKARIDPIAGTFRRTGDDQKDSELAEALLLDPKENAEHVMLVDLARNDLSRNASDVKVDVYKHIRFFSHVIHMVSEVSGKVFPGTNPIALFAGTFPAGTLSGAPKVRAMQLINELEPHNRSFYGGCIGYIGLNGDLNQAITIRSFMSQNNVLHYQAGGGIVSKSFPEGELQEVKNKLGALKKAIDLAAINKA